MSLQTKALSTLEGPTVARIRFRFSIAGSHVTIAPQTFHVVARAIRSGNITVRAPTDLDPGVGAQYNDVARTRKDGTVVAANTLEISDVTGRLHEAFIVHESLHAAYDLLGTGIDGNAEEASAYVCTALPHDRTAPSQMGQWPNLRECRTSRTVVARAISKRQSGYSMGWKCGVGGT
jgi:hypothetical protein